MTEPSAVPPALSRRTKADHAFRVARRTFVAAGRIDMQELARELEVDRSTLFRWVGNRDELVVSILMSLTDPTIQQAIADATGTGGERVADIAARYAQALIDAPFYRDFLRREESRALRLLTTKASPLQQHVVGVFADLLRSEERAGALLPPMPIEDLAYLIVRLFESFTYADLITGDDPDSSKVRSAVAVLLRS